MSEHNILGKLGEEQAKVFLEDSGYIILHTNWHYKHKEIDIIALNDKTLVIVEVKTRREGGQEVASKSITMSKMRYIVDATEAYISQMNCEKEVRFDVVAITLSKDKSWIIEHITDAFNAMEVN